MNTYLWDIFLVIIGFLLGFIIQVCFEDKKRITNTRLWINELYSYLEALSYELKQININDPNYSELQKVLALQVSIFGKRIDCKLPVELSDELREMTVILHNIRSKIASKQGFKQVEIMDYVGSMSVLKADLMFYKNRLENKWA